MEAEENQILEKPQNGLHTMVACFKTVMLFCEITFINDNQKIQTAKRLSKCNGGYQMTKTMEGK